MKLKKLCLYFLMPLLVLFGMTTFSNTVSAKELTNVISGINLWDTSEGRYVTQTGGTYQLVQGNSYRFETNFDLSAYNGNLEDGDKFTLTIPAPFTVNDGATINLTDTETGVIVGTATVSSSGTGQGGTVTVTLQNLADYLAAKGGTEIQGVKGTFYVDFTISELTTNQTITYSTTETTDTISHTITVKERESSDYSDSIGKANFSKFGGVLTKRAWTSEKLGISGDYVHPWTVRVNTRQASYDTITVSDTIEQNYAPMQYIPETLKVQYGYYNSSYSFSYDGVLVEGVDYTIEYNSSYTGFNLKILNTSTRLAKNGQPAAYQLSYSTTAPADGSTVANTVAVTGDDTPLTVNTDIKNTSMTITRSSKITEGGTITLDTGYRIILYKVDSETGSRLSGATFTITTPSGSTSTITTDENGRAYSEVYSAEEVAKGDFTITETTSPTGYQLLTEPIKVTVGSEGVIKTISNTKEKVSVPVTKTWNDSDNQDGVRPNVVTVKLRANGENVDNKILTLSEDNNWSGTFENLDKYDSAGNEITYTIEEDTVDDYTSRVTGDATNGYTITNTHTPVTIEASGKKTWSDNDDQDGIRPESIVVHLLANGVDTGQTKKVSQTNNWTYQFENLPKYQNGNEIAYTVSEEAVDGYTTAVDGYNITNTHTPETTEVSGTKTWDDNDDQDGKRPDSITVNLLANGTVVNSQTVTADSNWSYSFTNLPKYANGSEIAYTVTEDAVADYTTTIDGYNITNSYTPGETSITVTKAWDDNNDQDGLRPKSVKVQLYANGEKSGDAVTLTADDNWTYTWTGLAEKANKKAITYTVKEVSDVDGYSATTSAVENGNVTITNTHNPSTTSVTINKVWDDNDNQDGIRPTSVTVNLLADGEVVKTADVTPTADGDWTYTFTDLAEYSNGKKVAYTVEEANTPEGYTSSVDGTTITNTHTPETTEVSGTKIWDDSDDQDGKRPDAITVNLLANGTIVDTKTVTADDNWAYQFTNLPAKENGTAITYTVSEEAVADYTTTYDGYNITNSYTPGQTSVTVTKAWNDSDNQDGLRQAVEVALYADGVATGQTQTLSADNNWTYTWTGLAEKANKKAITYTVEEVTAIDGYTSETVQTSANNFTITNTHTPETTEVSGTKVWDDNDDQDGLRPDSIVVNLLANGEVVASQTVTADNDWNYAFTDLPKYDNGNEIVYTVGEATTPDGYTSSVDGTTITNTHTPATTEVSGTKTWADNENSVGLRPDSITVNLLANGTKVASQKVTAESDWNYSFTDLPKYANGNEITYTVTEDNVANYTPTYDGYNITNNYTPGQTSLTVTKAWDDNNDQDGIRPDSIQVQLYANGKEVEGGLVTLKASENWTHTWTGLDENLTYTVKEVSDIDGYTATVGDVENGNVTITNTHTPTTPDKPSSDEPTTPSQSGKKSNKKKNIITALLPSTGDSDGFGLSILGVTIIVVIIAGFVYYKVRKHN